MEIREVKDFYAKPKDGYRALHYIVQAAGRPVEIQVKTFRQSKLGESSHYPMKMKTLNKAEMDYLSSLAFAADGGDIAAASQVDPILEDTEALEARLTA